MKKERIHSLLCAMALVLGFATYSQAATITVTVTDERGPNCNNTPSNNNDGCGSLSDYKSEDETQCTLREAVCASICDVAVAGCTKGDPDPTPDTIFLPKNGTITFKAAVDADSTFGDLGKGPNAVSILKESVIIDGQGATLLRDDKAENGFRFFESKGILELHDLTLKNGLACAKGVNRDTVTESKTKSSKTDNSTFTKCNWGGAVRIDNSIFKADGVTFEGNSTIAADDSGDTKGGGAVAIAPDAFDKNVGIGPAAITSISNSKFTDNMSGLGGAVSMAFSQVDILSSTFSNNKAIPKDGPSLGGALIALGGDLSITGSSFSNNSAIIGGAVALSNLSDLSSLLELPANVYGIGQTYRISRTTFSANRAGLEDLPFGWGGAIFLSRTLPIGGDSSSKTPPPPPTQGGLTLKDPSGNNCDLLLNGITAAENASDFNGGAVYELDANACVENIILGDNTAKGSGPNFYGPMTSLGGNLFETRTDGIWVYTLNSTDVVADPRLKGTFDVTMGHYPAPAVAYDIANPKSATSQDALGHAWQGPPDAGAIEGGTKNNTSGGDNTGNGNNTGNGDNTGNGGSTDHGGSTNNTGPAGNTGSTGTTNNGTGTGGAGNGGTTVCDINSFNLKQASARGGGSQFCTHNTQCYLTPLPESLTVQNVYWLTLMIAVSGLLGVMRLVLTRRQRD